MIYFQISMLKIKYSKIEYFIGMQIERNIELWIVKVFYKKTYAEKILINLII